jgi:hypothetical protein
VFCLREAERGKRVSTDAFKITFSPIPDKSRDANTLGQAPTITEYLFPSHDDRKNATSTQDTNCTTPQTSISAPDCMQTGPKKNPRRNPGKSFCKEPVLIQWCASVQQNAKVEDTQKPCVVSKRQFGGVPVPVQSRTSAWGKECRGRGDAAPPPPKKSTATTPQGNLEGYHTFSRAKEAGEMKDNR